MQPMALSQNERMRTRKADEEGLLGDGEETHVGFPGTKSAVGIFRLHMHWHHHLPCLFLQMNTLGKSKASEERNQAKVTVTAW